MADPVELAYSRRAKEYIELLGSMTAVHPLDQRLVALWAKCVEGDVIDAGCGPGHWTDLLRELGAAAMGVDRVPEFIDSAREKYPYSMFQLGSVESLAVGTGSDIIETHTRTAAGHRPHAAIHARR